MTSDTNPNATHGDLQAMADEAYDTLRQILDIEGLALEAATLLPPFQRFLRATIAAAESSAPDDFTADYTRAYLTGRIAKEQVRIIAAAREMVHTATERAENHWQAAIARERRRLLGQTPDAAPATPTQTPTPRVSAPRAAPITAILAAIPIEPASGDAAPRSTAPQPAPFAAKADQAS